MLVNGLKFMLLCKEHYSFFDKFDVSLLSGWKLCQESQHVSGSMLYPNSKCNLEIYIRGEFNKFPFFFFCTGI